ncbi:MAG: cephalosporin hydroxylase [Chloroflexi bacterium]|nr:cephalosporin hydroxylase [Chloroflexota bacterium]
MDDRDLFYKARKENIKLLGKSEALNKLASDFVEQSAFFQYTYNFDWLGLPIIQLPQDIVAVQEIIWKVKPDVIVETGVARGGSLILSASILHILNGNGRVVGIDIDIREHNWKSIMEHPLAFRIHLIQGSSTDAETLVQVRKHITPGDKVLVILDSDHTHEHVSKELDLYSPLVRKGSYIIVMDTAIADRPEGFFPNRPWGKESNPRTAVRGFLKNNDRFEIDEEIGSKLLITVVPDGYVKCVKD